SLMKFIATSMSPSAISLYLSKMPTMSLLYERSCFILYTYFNTLSLISLAFFTVSLKVFILVNSGFLFFSSILLNSSSLYPVSPLTAGQTPSFMIQNCSYDPARYLDSVLNALYLTSKLATSVAPSMVLKPMPTSFNTNTGTPILGYMTSFLLFIFQFLASIGKVYLLFCHPFPAIHHSRL